MKQIITYSSVCDLAADENETTLNALKFVLFDAEIINTGIEKMLLIGAFNSFNTNKSYRVHFFNISPLFHPTNEMLETTNDSSSIIDVLENEFKKNINFLSNLNDQVYMLDDKCLIVSNMSFGDFCLLIPEGEIQNEGLLLELINNELKKISSYKKDDDITINDVKSQIMKRFETQHVYSHLPMFDKRKELLSSLLNAEVNNIEKEWELTRQASVCLYLFLEEANCVFFDSDGKKRKLPFEYQQDVENSFIRFKKYYDIFLNQIKSNNHYSDIIWSYSFLCYALMAALIGEPSQTEEFNNFHGFIPCVLEETQTIDSFYYDQYGLLYSMGFLCLPANTTFDVVGNIPPVVHEFFHHMYNPFRKERNEIIISLAISTVLSPIAKNVYRTNQNIKNTSFILFCKKVTNEYIKRINVIIPYINVQGLELIDSMSFLNIALNSAELLNFEDCYNSALLNDFNLLEMQIFLNNKEQCVESWNKNVDSFFVTYTMTLREIFSDIAMCLFLNIDLKEYFYLLASQPTWATKPVQCLGDSVFLRLGFMSRYLFYKESSKNDFNIGEWYIKINGIINELKDDNPHFEKNLENMRIYIDEYILICINKDEDYIKKYFNMSKDDNINKSIKDKNMRFIFEENIISFYDANNNPNNDSEEIKIINKWENHLKELMEGKKIIEEIRKIYTEFKTQDLDSKIKFNYKARLLLRDLFNVLPNFLEL